MQQRVEGAKPRESDSHDPELTGLLRGFSHSLEGNTASLQSGYWRRRVATTCRLPRILAISRHPRRCHAPLSRAALLLRLKAADKLTGVATSRQSDKLHPSGDETGARTRIKDLLFFV